MSTDASVYCARALDAIEKLEERIADHEADKLRAVAKERAATVKHLRDSALYAAAERIELGLHRGG